MSTYFAFRCPKHEEQGGFFSRQAWGWGNADIFTNFKFTVAHHDCGSLEILSEHDDLYGNHAEEGRFLKRLKDDEYLRADVWPYADEWEKVGVGFKESQQWWLSEELPRLSQNWDENSETPDLGSNERKEGE